MLRIAPMDSAPERIPPWSRVLGAILSMGVLGGCATVRVATDYDHTASFAKYHTYAMEPARQGQTLSPISEAALRAALRVNLSARKMEETYEWKDAGESIRNLLNQAPEHNAGQRVAVIKITTSKPDLAVVRHVFRQGKLSPLQFTSWGYGASWPYRDGRYGMWAGAPASYTAVNTYANGALVLDFVDTRTRKLVFRGIGRGVAGERESSAKNIEDAVAKIVAAMPVSPAHG